MTHNAKWPAWATAGRFYRIALTSLALARSAYDAAEREAST